MTFIMFWLKPYKHWAKEAKKKFLKGKNKVKNGLKKRQERAKKCI
jgi:hypothetical protein